MSQVQDFIKAHVDGTTGLVSRSIFSSEEIYKLELERIFARAWLFVGHETQIPKPGDFFLSRMGEESVILTRDRQNRIHVFLNSCRHRGMKVCRYDQGHTNGFSCPYHGWGYALDGKLVGVPRHECYGENLDKSQWGLHEVAQLHNYKGAIFATWDRNAPSFPDYIGEFSMLLDDLLDGVDGAEGKAELLDGVQKWRAPANWKFGSENSVGDMYHNISHQSVDRIGIGPSGKGRRDNEHEQGKLTTFSMPRYGHGGVLMVYDGDYPWVPTYQDHKVAAEYFEHAYYERQRRLGDRARVVAQVGNLFPNTAFLARQPRRIAVWHPGGSSQQSEYWAFYLVDKDMPPEVREMLRQYYLRYIGPPGMTEQDDMENWGLSSAATVGTIARRLPFNYALGLGTDNPKHPQIPGTIGPTLTEMGARGLYSFWKELMLADTWDDVMATREQRAKELAR